MDGGFAECTLSSHQPQAGPLDLCFSGMGGPRRAWTPVLSCSESVLQADCSRKVSGSSGGGGNGDHVLKLSSQGLFSSASSQGFHSVSPRSPRGL